ncbi:DinB family protein [Mucilaginibacter jinjuensis]|uniref:DinB family protein n=1 Tax=Mucilaginibacter jinjuensis TaxID=1176721 RepID=A0ABY7T4R3_9SPHI|nr:DinB family protein [Mucilaginibacter jinjuensis]WCT11254.1 DinB family protein [Mucilaginibacter jinjuensis]
MDKQHHILIDELVKLLRGGSAHASLKDALKDLPAELRGERPNNLPYSIWQLVEHIRITQWDMLEFSRDPNHQSPKWPDEYWPKEAAPADETAWKNTIQQIDLDLENFINLLKKDDIYQELPHGDGQSILREALQLADHTSYHISEIIIIRRLLNAWK